MGDKAKNLTELLGIDRMQAYNVHPQVNGTVQRWNRAPDRDLAYFKAAGDSDWDENFAFARCRHNTGVCAATCMTG